MGGTWSGRWRNHRKATTVEDSTLLDLGNLAREGTFTPGRSGVLRWFRGDKEFASIGYTVRAGEPGLVLTLFYRWGGQENGEDILEPIHLETTPLHFGGRRWWGICPLVLNGQACNRRVGKIYLPPGDRYFGCRHCYRLTYKSVQEHDKRVDALRRNPAALDAIFADPAAHIQSGRAILAIKALGHERG